MIKKIKTSKETSRLDQPIKRRDLLKYLSLQPLLLKEAVSKKPVKPLTVSKSEKPLNFIFILTDDLGWGDLGCYGNKIARTPNLDQLAKEGLQFTQFYTNSPVCSPSRAGCLTGLFPGRIKFHHTLHRPPENEKKGMPDSLDPKIPTLLTLLRNAGYYIGHYGKWHLGILDLARYGLHESGLTIGSIHRNPRYDFNNSTEAIINKGIAFLKANKDKPFYLQLWTYAPHAPLEPSEKQMSFFDNLVIKRLGDKFTSPAQVYYSVIRDLDYHLGRLFRALEFHGLQDNTMVIFASDNGPEDINILEVAHSGAGSTGPFRGRKRSLYEGGIRTPFITWCPAIVPSGRIDNKTILSGVDLLPTICNFAGIKVPEQINLDGEDMTDAFRGKEKKRGKSLMWEQRFQILGPPLNQSPMLAVREENWKLLMNPDKSRIELYDIIKDPMEVDNLSDTNPEVVAHLSKILLSWSKELPEGPIDKQAGSITYPWPGKNSK